MYKELKNELWKEFKKLGKDSLTMSHYDLADKTDILDTALWKQFLLEPEVSEWINSELEVLRNSELNKVIDGIGKSNSVGKAQIITALQKLNDNTGLKEGPIFIYTYIPLSSEQEQAENIIKLDEDPFIPRG